MFYESTFIDSLLKCHQCSRTYNSQEEPKTLTCCGKTICCECVRQTESRIEKNQYECIVCKEVGIVPSKGFPVNTMAVQLIKEKPKEVSRGKMYRHLKIQVSKLKRESDQLSVEIESNSKDSIKEICTEEKRRIQLAYEKKLLELNELHSKLIQKIEDHEKKMS